MTIKELVKKLDDAVKKNEFKPAWYAVLFEPHFIVRRALFASISNFSKTGMSGKILDIGCGEMPYRTLFPNCEYIGLEIAGGGHEDSKKKADRFFNGTEIPFPNEEFDIAIFTEVIEHVTDPDIILDEINRVLKKNGKLFLTVPFVADEHEIPFDFRRFTSFGLQKILNNHGFVLTKIERLSGIFASVGQLLSTFLFDLTFRKVNIRGYRKRFIFQKIFSFLICFPVQIIALGFDFIFNKKGIPLNYAITARKA